MPVAVTVGRGRCPALDRPRDHRRGPVGAAERRAPDRHDGPPDPSRRRPGDRRRGRRPRLGGAVGDPCPRRRRRCRRLADAAAPARLGRAPAGARPLPDRAPADHGGVGPRREARACRCPDRRAGPLDGHGRSRGRGDRPDLGRLLGALRRRPAVPRAGHADGRLAGAAGPGPDRASRSGRRSGLVLQEGALARQPGLVRRRRGRRARAAGDPHRLRAQRCRPRRRSRRRRPRSPRPLAPWAGPLGDPFVMPSGSSLHYLGTTRMGADGRRHQRLRPDRPRVGHRQPLRRRQQRHPDRHRLQPHARPPSRSAC